MPRLLEADAEFLTLNYDTLAPDKQAEAKDWLQRYKQQQADEGEPLFPSVVTRQVEQENSLRRMFEAPDKIDYDPGYTSADPLHDKMQHANMALLSARYQKEPAEIASRYDFLINDYARQKLGASEDVDTAKFYALAQKDMQKVKLREDTQREGMSAALRGEDGVKALAAWQAKNADRAKEDAGLFMRGYQQAIEQDGEMLPIADRLLKALESGTDKTGQNVQANMERGQVRQELGQMVEQLAGMKKAQRKSVYRSIAARIEAAGYDQKGFWSQMLGELDKGLYRMEGTLGTQAGIAADVATAVAGAQTRIPDTFDGSSVSLPVLSDEEQQALLRQRDYRERIGNVQEEIMQIVSGELDPVKPVTGWMNETVETGLIKGPGAVAPFMAASALLGPYGAGLVFTADFAEQNRRELVQSGLDADQARKVGAMAAPLQAAVESLSNMVSLGKFPAVQAALSRFTRPVGGASLVGRYIQNSLISGATEFTEEQVQDNVVVPAMQELLGALEKDVPEVDWSFYKTRAANATPELAATLLPMALVFGGVMTAADARLSDRMTSNVDALTALNYSQAQATEIVQEKTPEARIAKAASLWRSRAGNKATLEEGAAKLAERLKALSGDAVAYQAELERRGVLPRVMHTAENDWLLTFNDGSTARFATHDEASTARWTWAEDQLGRVHALTREALTSMERNMSTNRELGVEFKPDVRMVEAGQTTPDIQRRVEQGKVLGDIDPNEAFDTASMVDRATAEADGFLSSYQILGSSRNEFKDGVLRTTIKLWEGSNVLTLVEEKLEGDAKAIVASRGGRGWMLAVLRNYEQESGDKLFREVPDEQLTDDDLVEAWSHLGQSYLVGRSSFGEPLQQNNMRRFSRLLMRAGLAGALNSESTFWQAVVNRAQKLGELKAAGKLNEDVVAELEKQLGIDSQVKHEQGAMQEVQQVRDEVAQQVDTSGYSEATPGPNGETFSLDRAAAGGALHALSDRFYKGGQFMPPPDSLGSRKAKKELQKFEAFKSPDMVTPLRAEDKWMIRVVPLYSGEWAKRPVVVAKFDNESDAIDALHEAQFQLNERLGIPRAIPADASKVVQMPDGARLVGPTTFSIRAFHGTPHRVDRFRLDKIGTGEGAQAYGWGLYFAENRNVAEGYTIAGAGSAWIDTSTGRKMPLHASAELSRHKGDKKAALKALAAYPVDNQIKLAISAIKASGPLSKIGNLYTVELLPDADEFLDWDKPLSEQSEKVKAALKAVQAKPVTADGLDMGGGSVIRDNRRGQFDKSKPYPWLLVSGKSVFGLSQADVDRMTKAQTDATGENIYTRLTASEGSQKAASEYLASLGIPGIRYLDGGSRGAGDGTRNFVIFDENLVRILEENGKPVAQEPEQEPEPGELAPDSPVEDLPLEGDDIPWTEETFSIAPRVLPEVFPAFNEQIKNEIAAQTKTIAAIHIDRMKVGEFAGVPLQGGFFYPAIVDNLKKGVVWAFNADNIARGVANRAAANGGFIKLVLMQEGNVVGNKTFGTIWFKLLDEAIAAKRISKTAALTELNRVRAKFATHPDSNLRTDHVKTWKSVDEARNAIIGMPQKKRGATYFQKSKTVTKSQGVKIAYQSLLSQAMTEMGFPDAAAIVESIEEPSFKGVPTGAVVGIIKIDPLSESQKVMTATEAGVPEHLSYKYVLHGKPVARMTKFKVIDETFPETKNKLLSQQHTNFPLEAAFAETFSLRPGDFASRVEAMFSPFQRSPEARLVMARVAKDRALRLGNELIEKANVIRTMGSIDREARVRAALAEDKAVQDYLDGLTPAARQTLEWQPADLQDDPLIAAMLDFGKLMSKTTALQRGKLDLKMGDFDGAPWLPPSFYSKGSGIMPDQMAQAMFDAGLLPDAYTDTLWAELGKRIEASRKDKAAHREAVQAFQDAKKAARDAAAKEAGTWADNAKKQAGSGKAQRERIKAWLRVLDGILAASPPEVRARVGGFVKMAGIATDEAALRYLEDRVAKLDKELEKWLKKDATGSINRLFKKAAADYTAGKKAKGKLGPDEHYLFQRAEAASEMDAAALRGELAKLDALADDESLSDDQRALAVLERGIVELVGDMKNADSGRLFTAFDELTRLYSQGVVAWKAKQAARREARQAVRDALKADAGKSGVLKERQAMEKAMTTLFGKAKSAWLSVSSFSEVLRYAFGSKSQQATELIDGEREASNAYEDEQQAIADELEAFFASMAGGKVLDGERLRFDMAKRTIKAGDVELSQFEAITALLMWRQEDGRRHMEGTFDENGQRTSGWSYDQAWVDEVEKQLTPEGRRFMAWLAAKYGSEHGELNALYRERHGVNLPAHDNYAPITVKPMQAKAGEIVDPVSGAAVSGSILTPGSLRTRSRMAIAEPEFRDALQTFVAHKKQMGYWKAYYDLATDMQAVLGNRELMNSVEAAVGKEAVVTLRKWMDVLAQGGVRDASAGLAMNGMFQRMMNRAATVGLLGRVSTLLVQSTQLAAASVQMPVGAYLRRFGKLLAGQLDWKGAIQSAFIQRRIKTAPPIVRQAFENLANAKSPNEIKRATYNLGKLLSGTDGLFTGGTYAILLDYHRETGRKLGLTGDDLEEHAHREAERATEEVAQPTRTATRSLAELTATNPLAKVSFAYASEARQKIALLGWAAVNFKADPVRFGKAAFLVFGVGGVMSQVLKNIWKEAKGDDDEEKWSPERLIKGSFANALHGIPMMSELMGEPGMFSSTAWAQASLDDLLKGEADMRDINTLLGTVGLFNDTAAGVAAMSNAGYDFAKIIEAAFSDASSK